MREVRAREVLAGDWRAGGGVRAEGMEAMSSGDQAVPRRGLRADRLQWLIHQLDSHPALVDLLGRPPTAALALVADGRSLRIEETGAVALSDAQRHAVSEVVRQLAAKALG